MASVVLMIVPSKSNKKPAKAWVSGRPVNEPLPWLDAMVFNDGGDSSALAMVKLHTSYQECSQPHMRELVLK